jgi:hypothetical protein
MRRLIRSWTVFHATRQTSMFRSAFGTASYRQLVGSGTFLWAHIATPTWLETHVTNTIDIEIVYNMYQMKPVVVVGPSQLCHLGNLQVRA